MGKNLSLKPEENGYRLYEGVDYKGFWESQARLKLDELERAIITELLPASGQRLIDIGCGFGRLYPIYEGRFQEIVLFDGSMSLLHQARENITGKGVFVAGDIYHLPFKDGVFDAALLIRVFHHLPDSKAGLLEIRRIINTQGQLIFNYLNKKNPLRLIKRVLGRNSDNPLSLEPDRRYPDMIAHHPIFVKNVLRETGFDHLIYRGAGVMDWIADKVDARGKWVPIGKSISPFLGRSKMAPWIFCSCHKKESLPILPFKNFMDIFACPLCHSDLIQSQNTYQCLLCKKTFPINEEIIDFRI